MKKIQSLIFTSLFALSFNASASGDFGLEEMHHASELGISWYLEQSGKSADEVRGYSIVKDGEDAGKLRIFFKSGGQVKLHCHFHGHHAIEEIDCHIM